MLVHINPEYSPKRISHELPHPIVLPPDKSIFHRLLILGSISRSNIRIPISSIEEIPVDVYATILALQSLGVPIEISRSQIEIQGVGNHGFHEPKHQINCANSGTTARLLMGLLAGEPFSSKLTGDESLSQRPMRRLAEIFNSNLGAAITTNEDGTMPITITGKDLHSGNIQLPVASAQMKSSLLIAAISSKNMISVTEPLQSRDHTEKMLDAFGTGFSKDGNINTVTQDYHFTIPPELGYHIPGDLSSAAFLIAAAIISRRNITLKNLGFNTTRRRFLDILETSGLEIGISDERTEWNEQRATIEIFAAESEVSKPFIIDPAEIPLLIDEIPVLSMLAAFCNGETIISGANELRNKESDRLTAIISNLKDFGCQVEEREDGMMIFGNQSFIPLGKEVASYNDHRIAMAFSIMALRAKETVTISDASVVSISYPNFFQDLAFVAGPGRIRIS